MASHIAGIIIKNGGVRGGRVRQHCLWDSLGCLETVCPNSIWSIIRNASSKIHTHSQTNEDESERETFTKHIIGMNNWDRRTLPLQNTVQILTPISHKQARDGTCPAVASMEWFLGLFSGSFSQPDAQCAAEQVPYPELLFCVAFVHIGLYGDLLSGKSECFMHIVRCVQPEGMMPCDPIQEKKISCGHDQGWRVSRGACPLCAWVGIAAWAHASLLLVWKASLPENPQALITCSPLSFDGQHSDTKWGDWSQQRRKNLDGDAFWWGPESHNIADSVSLLPVLQRVIIQDSVSVCLNSCKNRDTRLKLNTHLSTILNQFCAFSAQSNETPHHQGVGREQGRSANKRLVIIFPLVPVSLSLQGRVQNPVSCTASSLALFHLLKGWTQIMKFSRKSRSSAPVLRLIVDFSLPLPLWCVWKKK